MSVIKTSTLTYANYCLLKTSSLFSWLQLSGVWEDESPAHLNLQIMKNFTCHVLLHKLFVFIYFLYQKIVYPCKICLGIWTMFLSFFKSSLPIYSIHLHIIIFYCNVKHYLFVLKYRSTWDIYEIHTDTYAFVFWTIQKKCDEEQDY